MGYTDSFQGKASELLKSWLHKRRSSKNDLQALRNRWVKKHRPNNAYTAGYRSYNTIRLFRLFLWPLFNVQQTSSPLLRGTPDTARKRCRTLSEFHTEAPQAAARDGLAQGLYVTARVGFKPPTLTTFNKNVPFHDALIFKSDACWIYRPYIIRESEATQKITLNFRLYKETIAKTKT